MINPNCLSMRFLFFDFFCITFAMFNIMFNACLSGKLLHFTFAGNLFVISKQIFFFLQNNYFITWRAQEMSKIPFLKSKKYCSFYRKRILWAALQQIDLQEIFFTTGKDQCSVQRITFNLSAELVTLYYFTDSSTRNKNKQ